MANILIFYGSTEGQTAKIAENMAGQIRSRGHQVELRLGKGLPKDFSVTGVAASDRPKDREAANELVRKFNEYTNWTPYMSALRGFGWGWWPDLPSLLCCWRGGFIPSRQRENDRRAMSHDLSDLMSLPGVANDRGRQWGYPLCGSPILFAMQKWRNLMVRRAGVTDSIAAALLRFIKRKIGSPDQFVGSLAMARVARYSDGQGGNEFGAAEGNAQVRKILPKQFSTLSCHFRRCIWQHQEKFLAAITAGNVTATGVTL